MHYFPRAPIFPKHSFPPGGPDRRPADKTTATRKKGLPCRPSEPLTDSGDHDDGVQQSPGEGPLQLGVLFAVVALLAHGLHEGDLESPQPGHGLSRPVGLVQERRVGRQLLLERL